MSDDKTATYGEDGDGASSIREELVAAQSSRAEVSWELGCDLQASENLIFLE